MVGFRIFLNREITLGFWIFNKIEVYFPEKISAYKQQKIKMSSKTSSRSNTQSHKAHTRKNCCGMYKFLVAREVKMEVYVKYFYKGRPCVSLPEQHLTMTFEKLAKITIRKMLESGKNLKEIIDFTKKNMDNNLKKIEYLEMLDKAGIPMDSEKIFGCDPKEFLIDWNCSIAMLVKLKAIKNDDKNGKLSYVSTEQIEKQVRGRF